MKPGGSGMSRVEGAAEPSVNSTAHLLPNPNTPLPFSISLCISLSLSLCVTLLLLKNPPLTVDKISNDNIIRPESTRQARSTGPGLIRPSHSFPIHNLGGQNADSFPTLQHQLSGAATCRRQTRR